MSLVLKFEVAPVSINAEMFLYKSPNTWSVIKVFFWGGGSFNYTEFPFIDKNYVLNCNKGCSGLCELVMAFNHIA